MEYSAYHVPATAATGIKPLEHARTASVEPSGMPQSVSANATEAHLTYYQGIHASDAPVINISILSI